jgi:hypothetical protein
MYGWFQGQLLVLMESVGEVRSGGQTRSVALHVTRTILILQMDHSIHTV